MFQKIIIALIFLIIGSFLGYAVTNKAEAPSVLREETAAKGNAFFELVDSYTYDKDTGGVGVSFTKPEADSIVFGYPTSQESSETGVYNYKTGEMHMGLGGSSYGDSQIPVAMIGNDKLLFVRYEEESPFPKLVVKDFANKIIATVAIPDAEYPYYHEAYGFNAPNGGQITFSSTPEYKETTKYKTFKFDEKTYTLGTN